VITGAVGKGNTLAAKSVGSWNKATVENLTKLRLGWQVLQTKIRLMPTAQKYTEYETDLRRKKNQQRNDAKSPRFDQRVRLKGQQLGCNS